MRKLLSRDVREVYFIDNLLNKKSTDQINKINKKKAQNWRKYI